jgi:cytochrome c oxidase assembly factor CtaG
MIEEGRRQLDRQLSDLEQIRGRAQWLFTVGAAITTVLAGTFAANHGQGGRLALWVLGIALLVVGVAGAAAVMTSRADFRMIDTAVLSGYAPPVHPLLARDYSRMLRVGENTVATRLTIFRQAVLYVILGGYLGLLASLLGD